MQASSLPALPRLVERVLSRLEQAERSELNPHARYDYRIAWITVLYAARGNSQPHTDATYRVLGLHPEKVWPSIVARRRALLGAWYEEFHGLMLAPKKPVQSVPWSKSERRESSDLPRRLKQS